MDKLHITGGSRLAGEVTISGAKNAALPILCASLLTADTITLQNVPALNDIGTTLKLLKQLGVQSDHSKDGIVHLDASQIGRAHVLTPVTNAHLVCRLLLAKKKE